MATTAPILPKAEAAQIANTILAQLGGTRFVVMTGANRLMFTETGALEFFIPRARGISLVRIRLNASDLYDLSFLPQPKASKPSSIVPLAVTLNVDVSDLRRVFEEHTGLATSL
jgi:hypothetical protein